MAAYRMTDTQVKDELARCERYLGIVDAELGRMPNFKFGTTWHQDRLNEQRNILKNIEHYKRVRLGLE